jgi:hypothetical protein
MRIRFIVLALVFAACGQKLLRSQDTYEKTIERLRSNGKLTTKSSTDKTFVGSVTAYYDNDSLVLINSLADAEAAGTETLYYIKDGILIKVLIMSATFDSNDEWAEYYSRHKAVDKCYTCHGKPNCIVTEINVEGQPTMTVTENGKDRPLTDDEKINMIADARKTSEALKVLLKEL